MECFDARIGSTQRTRQGPKYLREPAIAGGASCACGGRSTDRSQENLRVSDFAVPPVAHRSISCATIARDAIGPNAMSTSTLPTTAKFAAAPQRLTV